MIDAKLPVGSSCRKRPPPSTQIDELDKDIPLTTSLYERLGGAQGMPRLVDDVVAAHLSNPVVKTRFEAVKDLPRLKQLAVEFFSAGSGGAVAYTGRDMLSTHRGMNISEQEYLAVMDDIVGAMTKNGIGEDAKNEVVAILYSLKGEIIRV